MIASVVSTFAIIKICYAPFVKTAETATSKCFVEVWQIDRNILLQLLSNWINTPRAMVPYYIKQYELQKSVKISTIIATLTHILQAQIL